MTKMLGQTVYFQLTSYISEYILLSLSQFRLRKSLSTGGAVQRLVFDTNSSKNKQKLTFCVFLILSIGFETMKRTIFSSELCHYRSKEVLP